MAKSSERRKGASGSRGKRMSQQEELRVVVFMEGEQWVAQCLEYDIGAQGSSLEELRSRFEATLNAERMESRRRNVKDFAGIDPAPAYFKDMWNKCPGEYTPTPAPKDIPFRMAMCA